MAADTHIRVDFHHVEILFCWLLFSCWRLDQEFSLTLGSAILVMGTEAKTKRETHVNFLSDTYLVRDKKRYKC